MPQRSHREVTSVPRELKVFSGSACRDLALSVCEHLKLPLGNCLTQRFANGEVRIQIEENVRGADVFLIQSTSEPVNEHLMELLIMMDALRRASAGEITAVIPFFGYARQDRKDQPRVPITAKLVANLITTAGADRVVTMDLHSGQIQGFFDIPVDHLYASPVLIKHFVQMELPNVVVMAPDVGSVKIARAYAKSLGASLAIADKRRPRPNVAEIMHIIGDVADSNVFIIDDMIDTGGTMVEAASAAKKAGAQEIYAAVTHPVLSGPALERLEKSAIKELVVTDTIPLPPGKRHPKIKVISVAPLFAEAITRIHNEESVSSLFGIQI